MSRSNDARVGICMGSDSDWATMEVVILKKNYVN